MKKLLAGLLVVLTAGAAMAASMPKRRGVPSGPDGAPISHPLYGGYDYFRKATAAEAMVCTGKCLIAGVVMGTGAPTSYLKIRDTSTADGGGSVVFGNIKFDRATKYVENPIALPVVSTYGFSAELSSIAADEEVTILYLDLDAQ